MAPTPRRLALAAGCAGAVLWLATAAGQEAGPARGLRIPLKFYEDGRVRMQFTAGAAEVKADGSVKAVDAVVEVYDAEGRVESRLWAETCLLNQAAGRATSDTKVKLERPGMVVAGRGMEWDSETETVVILERVSVRLVGKNGRGIGAMLPGGQARKGGKQP
jgi:hypothetical protein